MAEVADPTLGAKYQNALVEELRNEFKETVGFYLKVLMQDGFLPGTEPPKTVREGVVQGEPTAVALIQQVQAGEELTTREQRFLVEWLEARRNLNGNSSG